MKRIAAILLLALLVTIMLQPVAFAVNNSSTNPVLVADGVDPPPPFRQPSSFELV